MARTKVDRMVALKNFVDGLKGSYPNVRSYNRAMIDDIAETNVIGMIMFADAKQGFGKITRLSRGTYTIPASWENGQAPWEAQVQSTDTKTMIASA